MTILCINCAQADLEKATVRLSGEIRKYPYTVEMEGLKCPKCGYATVDRKSMSELGRLAADEYRRANGLLTSNELLALRHQFGDSQDSFSKRTGVSVASIKRYELGKIQEKHIDDLIREKTNPQVEETQQYCFSTSGGTLSGCAANVISYGAQGATIGIRVSQQEATVVWNTVNVEHVAATVPPFIANWRLRGDNDRDTAGPAT